MLKLATIQFNLGAAIHSQLCEAVDFWRNGEVQLETVGMRAGASLKSDNPSSLEHVHLQIALECSETL